MMSASLNAASMPFVHDLEAGAELARLLLRLSTISGISLNSGG